MPRQYIRLDHKEVSSKLRQLKKNSVIEVFDHQKHFHHFHLEQYSSRDNSLLLTLPPNTERKLKEGKVALKVTLKSTYVIACGILSQEGTHFRILIELESVYKMERRRHDRLLCYPHRSLYLRYHSPKKEEVSGGKLLSFSRDDEIIKELFHSLNPEPENHAFRIVDVSPTGLSILLSEYELKFIKGHHLTRYNIDIDGQDYFLQTPMITYQVNYVDPQVGRVLLKVGITFQLNKDLESRIKRDLGEELERVVLSSLLRDPDHKEDL